MKKVLIVDDSISSITDVKTMLNWEDHGYEIIGEASNGSEAIKRIQSELPDLVITDMNMPIVNGIELIEYIKENCPQVKIIALSAYDDFDLVRQSMRNGAVDYILKHQLHAAELLELLQAIAEDIRMERNKQNDADHLSGSKKLLRHELISTLLEGRAADIEEITPRLQHLELGIGLENLMVTVAEIDDYWSIEERFTPSELDILINTFLDISEKIMNEWEMSVIAPITKGQFAMIFSLGNVYSKMYNYNRQYSILNRIRSEMKRFLNITVSFGVSKPCPTIADLPQAYQEAKLMLENKFYNGKNGIYIESAAKLEDGIYCLDIQEEKAIYDALRNLDVERVNQQIKQIFHNISKLRLRSNSTRMVIAELINILNKVCKDNGIEVSRLYTIQDVPYNMMQKYETLQDIERWVLNLYHKLLTILEQLRVDSNVIDSNVSKLTRKAVAYIKNNYSHDISLTDVAEFVGISSPYMSKLFKEECGLGFAEYLNRVRINNAKWYIEHSEDKLIEVVGRVGFNNYNYFFRVFKKMEGITPLEFEKKCRNTG